MNITDLLLSSNNSGAIGALAKNFGIDENMAQMAVKALAPALSKGLGHHTQQQTGLESLLGALQKGNHSRYIDNPETLGQASTTQDGNSILGHIFGSKEVSRHVAGNAAKSTGLSSELVKKMLPVVATMVMGSLSKKAMGGRSAAPQQSAGLVSSLLDSNNDGSMLDDVLGMAFKMAFKK